MNTKAGEGNGMDVQIKKPRGLPNNTAFLNLIFIPILHSGLFC